MGRVWCDYEALGNGFLEVIPTVRGDEPAGLAHIPATQMWGPARRARIRPAVGRLSIRTSASLVLIRRRTPNCRIRINWRPGHNATSIIHFSQYNAWSPYYGIPSIMPAWQRALHDDIDQRIQPSVLRQQRDP